MTNDREIFQIPEANYARFEREIEKLSQKAEKLGFAPFLYMVQNITKDARGRDVFEVALFSDVVKFDGWTVVARIDHSNDTGNIVRSLPSQTVAERYRHAAPDCEHCNHKRKRRDTFVLAHEDGTQKQVGSTCLSDFLGHDANHIGRMAEVASYAREFARSSEEPVNEGSGLADRRYVSLHEYLVYCAASVRENGWVSGKAAYENRNLTSTREDGYTRMHEGRLTTEVDVENANKALAWAQSFADKDNLSDYEHNVLVIANAVVIEGRSCGIAASIVGVWMKNNTARAKSANLGDMSDLLGLFKTAGSRLRSPKLIIDLGNVGVLELTVAKDHHMVPGSINVKRQGGFNAPWLGRIMPNGEFKPSFKAPAGIENELLVLAADPAGVAAKHGHKTGRCCFCNLPLKDARSVEVGYGKTCASNWGQPWGKIEKEAA